MQRIRTPDDDTLLPSHICASAAEALGAAGVSLTLAIADLRLPLGTSDDTAALAESAQFTEGDGPCIEALNRGERLNATEHELNTQWPRLAARWRERTPYRSVLAVPLPIDGAAASMNVYLDHDSGGRYLDPTGVDAVVRLVADHLHGLGATLLPSTRRTQMWIVLGLVVGHYEISAESALERLRGHATATGLLLDDVSASILDGRITLDDLARPGPSM